MVSGFGARLRAQRERQQVELATIAEQTKIRLALLEELERDDVSHWPAGIFRRSYIRSYARAVGLEPDAVVREFLEAYPDTVEESIEVVAAARGVSVEPVRQSPPTRLQFLFHSAMDALPALHFQPGHKSSPAAVTPDAVAQPIEAASAAEPEPPSALAEPPAAPPEPPPEQSAPPPPVLETSKTADDQPPGAGAEGSSRAEVDLPAIARLCTGLGCAVAADDVLSRLEDAARILDAVGLTMWMADHQHWLTPVFAHGYPSGVAKLPHVPGDADNAVAAAFRSAEIRVVDGSTVATGAVAVPIMTSAGCAGVLALEFLHRREQHEWVRAAATILAAQLSTLIVSPSLVRAATA
jgi:GAF domain-containing protein